MIPEADEIYLFDSLTWHLTRRQPGLREGAHPGRLRGAGSAFADVAPLLAYPDPRRLDLRRSITDPFGGFFVHRFERHTDLVLHILLDASASLGAIASANRQRVAALLAGGLAQAARRGGDRVAMQVVNGEDLVLDLLPTRRTGIGEAIREDVVRILPSGHGVEGLCHAAAGLPQSRVLVVLVSDFDHTTAELNQLLGALSPRPVLPLWLRDTGLEAPPGRIGLSEMRDPESGRCQTVLTGRKWALRQAEAGHARRRELRAVFASHGLRPVEISDSIDLSHLIAELDEAPR